MTDCYLPNNHPAYGSPKCFSVKVDSRRQYSSYDQKHYSCRREYGERRSEIYSRAHDWYTSASSNLSVNDDSRRQYSSNRFSRTSRDDSITSSTVSGAIYRSHPSNDFMYGPVEYEPLEKANTPFKSNQNIKSGSFYSTTSNVRELFYRQGDRSETIEQFVSTDEDEEQSEPSNPIVDANPETTLPILSQECLYSCPLPASDQQPSVNRQPHGPVQKQDTHHDLNKKAVFPGKDGRNSIGLMLTTRQIYHVQSSTSHDNHVNVPDLQEACKSPRRSRVLSAKRKQQLKSQKNVLSDSPEPVLKSTSQQSMSSHSNGSMTNVGGASYRTTSPEGDVSEDFSFLEENEQVFSDSENHRPHLHPLGLSRDVYSPSSDSSPGPSSLEEARGTERRHHVLQRVDTDLGEQHSKILLANGSLTPAQAKHMQDYRCEFQDLVTVRYSLAYRSTMGEVKSVH